MGATTSGVRAESINFVFNVGLNVRNKESIRVFGTLTWHAEMDM